MPSLFFSNHVHFSMTTIRIQSFTVVFAYFVISIFSILSTFTYFVISIFACRRKFHEYHKRCRVVPFTMAVPSFTYTVHNDV